MNNFQNKIVWITGASSGIGLELAKQLAKQHAKIVLSARSFESLEEVRQTLHQPENHISLALDLEKSDTFQDLFAIVLKKYGTLDYLFNNGGLSQRSEAHETQLEVDRKIMEINYFGNISLTKTVLPHFREKKSGHIIVTSSIAGKFGFFLRSAYSASKHALQGFYESLALEEEKNNIHVTMLVPGKINTPISTNALTGEGAKHGFMDHNQETGMPVEVCVQKIIKATLQKKREILIGNKEIKAVTLKRFFPALFWKVIRKQSAT
jgi:dehydrogenase/reductase SDR family protein 7B